MDRFLRSGAAGIFGGDQDQKKKGDEGLSPSSRFYNTERPHQALGYLTPAGVFTSTRVKAASGGMIEFLASDSL